MDADHADHVDHAGDAGDASDAGEADHAGHVQRNRTRQREIYGEPLSELFGRIASTLGLTQVRLAEAVGLSAPMLSQLIGGHRAKIGNPAVVQRTQELLGLAEEVRTHGLSPSELESRINQIKGANGVFTRTAEQIERPDPQSGARAVQGLLRAVASADELSRAARKLDKEFPALAEVLRVYGTGRTAQAQQHFNQLLHLI